MGCGRYKQSKFITKFTMLEWNRSSKPHEDCHATKDDLMIGDRYQVWNDCPVCERRGILCEIGCHPVSAGKLYFSHCISFF